MIDLLMKHFKEFREYDLADQIGVMTIGGLGFATVGIVLFERFF